MSNNNSISTGISNEDIQLVCCHGGHKWTFRWYWQALSDYLLTTPLRILVQLDVVYYSKTENKEW